MNKQPLLKLLMSAGLGSRRYITNIIKQGRISINGEKVQSFSSLVDLQNDSVLIDNKPVRLKQKPKIVLLLNKPAGLLSTTRDERGRKTVMDIIPHKYKNMMLYPIGRLDKNTTGLLLLSNDGELTYELTHPKFEHEKEYLVSVDKKLNSSELQKIETGVQLEDGITYPARIKRHKTGLPFTYTVTIHEGRKRQIHRMFEKLGYKILALKRVRVGGIKLGNTREGEVRQLSDFEIQKLFNHSK